MYIVKEDPGGHTHNILYKRTRGNMYVYYTRGRGGTCT